MSLYRQLQIRHRTDDTPPASITSPRRHLVAHLRSATLLASAIAQATLRALLDSQIQNDNRLLHLIVSRQAR